MRRLDRLYHRTSLTSDRRRWVEAIRAMHALFTSKERGFWEARIEAAAGDSKKCWRTMNKLTGKGSKRKIPDSVILQSFVSKFVVQKVNAVRAATSSADAPVFTPCPKPGSFESLSPSPQSRFFF